jgi:thiamine pyrophosphate-dependent acetolactate synthase large subunit-like protein
MKMQIGAFLARRLAESGVRHVFGVPGISIFPCWNRFRLTRRWFFVATWVSATVPA